MILSLQNLTWMDVKQTQVQEHGFGNGAVEGGYSEDEGDERDEQERS